MVEAEAAMPAPENNSEPLKVMPPGYIFHSRPFIQEGDVVIMYLKRDFIQAITITRGQVIHNKFGKYTHDSLIGVKFGSRVTSAPPHQGFIHLLRPTPELWTFSLPHRTQIVYQPDISFITAKLGVRTGGRAIEAGTGSGSMSHSLARTLRGVSGGGVQDGSASIKGKGVLYSYEYHATRFEKAKAEFEEHGLTDTIHLRHRNVCKEGFGDVAEGVDSVFLDLPAPWEAIPHAVKALRPDILTRICCFSPCIEQVTRTVMALDAEGFTDIEMHEVLVRAHEVQMPQPTFRTVSVISQKLRGHAVKKENRRQLQMAAAHARKLAAQEADKEAGEDAETAGTTETPSETALGKRKREEGDEELAAAQDAPSRNAGESSIAADAPEKASKPSNGLEQSEDAQGDDLPPPPTESWSLRSRPTFIAKPVAEMRGHTSYLTFAVMYPKVVRDEIEARYAERDAAKAQNGAKREGSIDSAVSEGFEKAMAEMTEEEMMALS